MKGLPDCVAPAVEGATAVAGRGLLVLISRQNAACKAAADKERDELRADKRNANWRIAELATALQEQEDGTRKLIKERDGATAHLADTREQLRSMQVGLECKGRDADSIDRLLSQLRNPAMRDDNRAALTAIVGAAEQDN